MKDMSKIETKVVHPGKNKTSNAPKGEKKQDAKTAEKEK